MFTGIIKDIGIVRSFGRAGDVRKLDIESIVLHEDIGIGDSACVNGVCLTLTGKDRKILAFDVMDETLESSALGGLKTGGRVNLESAVKANGAFGGHFVTGHVDCAGTVRDISKGNRHVISVGFPENFSHLVVEKGSVALDGVSLTIGGLSRGSFSAYIIPHTLKATTLGFKKPGDKVNIEFDIMGKYCERFLAAGKPVSRITEAFLKDKGFL